MIPTPYRLRRPRRYLSRNRRRICVVLLLLFIIDAFFLLANRPRTTRVTTDPYRRPEDKPSVFIVSVHRNTADILPAWSDAVLALVDYLGRDRVYFSAVESGSQDSTKEGLLWLKGELDARGVPNTVDLGPDVYQQLDEMWTRPDPDGPRQEGWIWNEEDDVYDLRRITYLAKERNRAMKPLEDLARKGSSYQKVLWVNDVIFELADFLTLLQTNDGNYAAVCSMDFKGTPWQYYDTFALRDDLGQKTVSNFWPWFSSSSNRDSAQRSEPMRVESCWNGMVLFDAQPFTGVTPLRFRAIPDSLADLHLEGSECCLIHADNPQSVMEDRGVWLNPNVRVGYHQVMYARVQAKDGETYPGVVPTIIGAWAFRWMQWRAPVQQYVERASVVKRVKRWLDGTPHGEPLRQEPGVNCLINEKQIMWMNGWRHL